MRFTHSYPAVVKLPDVFTCRARRKDLTLGQCLDDYLDATVFSRRRSACFRCPQGRRNRETFADGHSERDED